jgi:type I restriction enzyme, S subunit
VDTRNLKYLTLEDYEMLKNYFISKNDIYFSIAGTIGLVGLIPEELSGAILTENAAKIVIKNLDLIDKRFVALFLNSFWGRNQIKALTSKSTQPKLGLYRIEQIKLPLPPLSEQQEIAEILQTIDQKIEIEKRKKELYEELFKTMLNKIMNQEIDVEKMEV